MAKDKKKSKVGFQFTALQKRIKLLNAKLLLLEEKNSRLEAESRENWRSQAAKEGALHLAAQLEKDLYSTPELKFEGMSAQLPPKKPWWKLF